MKIDTANYMTISEAQAALGCSPRGIYRAIARARAAGNAVTEEVFGKTLVIKSALDTLKAFYFPYYSEAHQAVVKSWGSAGGKAKAKNARQAGRKRAGASGKRDAPA
jgi:hypothetical protein